MAGAGLAAVFAGLTAFWLGSATVAAQEQAQPSPEPQAQPQSQPQAQSQPPQRDFTGWLQEVRADALSRGISQATIDKALGDIAPIDRVIELDRRQAEFTLTFTDYLTKVVSPARVSDGRQKLHDNRRLLGAVARHYRVPAPVIVAMWGAESNYGTATGGFPVVPALATLAFDGRRSQYFRGELMNALQIVDRGMPDARMRGSWAGAMGQCQFMPSTYLRYARSWGDGEVPDIWTSPPDVFASTANYLSQIGWNPRQHWGREVALPRHGVASALFGLEVRRSLREWHKLGLRRADGKPLPARGDIQASLIRGETGKGDDVGKGPPYLVYDNFRVIMKWNRSVFFALAAGTLADRIGSR